MVWYGINASELERSYERDAVKVQTVIIKPQSSFGFKITFYLLSSHFLLCYLTVISFHFAF